VAFERLVHRADLEGQAMMAVMSRNGRPIAYHRFNAAKGSHSYDWRGRNLALQKRLRKFL